ncbi:NAD dependent epimerase/dehydratase [Phlyctema vagabunda]|uniref:NAD dependent epimerase/dehydratase n=1 Tax=Phlyctema vagabunda TaxID=108571 RepID=A0ABR4P7C1_9HELO
MASPRVLLLGGHGKISLLMTPKIVSRSWNLTSVIRNPDQKSTIVDAGKNGPGKVDVLIASLDNVKTQADAQQILDQAKPDYVIFSAGAGGKGGADRTYAIDRDAAIAFIKSSIATPSIKKFLLVTALIERRKRASWWDDDSWNKVQETNNKVLPDYYKAKLAADDVLTLLGNERMQKDKSFSYILVRPGTLADGPETGKVELGRTTAQGDVSRADVADVTVRLLEKEGVSGWIDMMNADKDVASEVDRVVREKVNTVEGEDLEAMKASL